MGRHKALVAVVGMSGESTPQSRDVRGRDTSDVRAYMMGMECLRQGAPLIRRGTSGQGKGRMHGRDTRRRAFASLLSRHLVAGPLCGLT